MGLIPSAQSMKPEIKVEIMQNLDCVLSTFVKKDQLLETNPRAVLNLEIYFNKVIAKI